MNLAEPAPDWEHIRPLLDAALDELSAADRDAINLRFLEQRSLAEVGAALGANEDAARTRRLKPAWWPPGNCNCRNWQS